MTISELRIYKYASPDGLGDPADALGYQYYIVPVDGADNPLTPPSNTVNFAAG